MVEKNQILINKQEQKLFETLMQVVRQNNLNTTLRVAGGWVRDKVTSNLLKFR